MRRIHNKENKLTSNPKEIINELQGFYENLYHESSNTFLQETEQVFLQSQGIPQLNEEERNSCEGILTINECYQALKSFADGKSPGNDGLTTEFYRWFWPIVGRNVTDSLNYSYEHGKLSNSQRQAIIKPIEKKEKDKRYISNWRPISLINIDAKIGSKALAKRMEKVLPTIVHFNQCAYVKDRSTFDALRTIEDIMTYSKMKNLQGLMVAIDSEKAFDSVKWNFLYKTLTSFGFGPSFVKWVKTYNCDIKSCITNNGFTNGYFKIKKGVRQGDPLSAYLFTLVIEILAIQIRSDSTIKGVSIGGKETKLSIFADDLIAFLANKASYDNLIAILEKFYKVSGLKVNNDKTEAYWLGKYHDNPPTVLSNIKSINKPIKILGIFFSYNDNLRDTLNFDHAIKSVKKTLNSGNGEI